MHKDSVLKRTTLNKTKLQASARELRRILDKYALMNPAAASLSAQLQDLLERAERFSILQEVEIGDIPGHKLLSETGLQGYTDLSEAYAAFYIELTGGESEALKAFKTRRGQQQARTHCRNGICEHSCM